MKTEKDYTPVSGYLMFVVFLVLLGVGLLGGLRTFNPLFFLIVALAIFLLPGFFFR